MSLAQDLKKFSQLKYHYIHNRFRSPLYTYLLWEGLVRHHNQDVSFDYQLNNMINLKNDLAVGKKEWDILVQAIEQELKNDFQLFNDLLKQSQQKNQQLLDQIMILQQKTNAENLAKFFQLTYEFGAFNIFTLLLEKNFEQQLFTIIKKSFHKDQEKILLALTTPQKPSIIQQQELDLFRLALIKNKTEQQEEIEKHLEQYAWLKDTSMTGDYYTAAEIQEQLQKIQDPEAQIADYQAKIKEQKNDFEKYYQKLNKQEQKLVEILLESIFFRSWRTERFYYNAFLLTEVYQKLAVNLGLDKYQDIFYLIPPEILSLLSATEKADQEIISQRKKGYVMLADEENTRIYSGSAVEKFLAQVKVTETSVNNQSLKGSVAYQGKAQGPVCLVESKEDFSKITAGCILVTKSTTPDYVPYLKMVRGIITDEGGITSHAAIISRELHIPCLIGTKNATQILKSGQIIELNTDQGEIIVKV